MLKTIKKTGALTMLILIFFSMMTARANGQFVYLGVEPVYSWTHLKWQNADPDGQYGGTVIDQTVNTLQAGLFIGYGILIDRIYLDVEAATEFGQRFASSVTVNDQTQSSLTNEASLGAIYIVDFRPGTVLWNTHSVLYGIVGLNSASFTVTQEDSDGLILQDSGAIRRNGLRYGGGYSWGLGKYYLLRLEYVYTKFTDFQFTANVPNSKQSHTWRLGADSHELTFGLAFSINI